MDIQVILSVALTLFSTQAEKCSEEQHCSNCSSTSGYCITDCFPGYFDLKCTSPCNKNCKNSKCSQNLNGIPTCSNGCVPGFYGSQCNIPCPSRNRKCTKCPQGCDGQFCNLTSSCVSGCPDSYYGYNCKTCSLRCRHCNRITGRCDVCHDPYSGGDCQFSCEHCTTTDCVQTCAPGLYGHTCSKTCTNCLAHPAANTNTTMTSNSSNTCTSECQRYSGECIHGCVDGLPGTNCSLKIQWKYKTSTPDNIQCNSNCMGCNTTGACVEGCSPGYYGDDCKPCSETCFNHTCHPNNGTCDSGCVQGKYGQFCTLPCTNCPGATCHPSTGRCDEVSGSSVINPAIIGTSTALVVLVFGIIVTVCIFHCKRVSANRDNQGDEFIHTERSGQVEPLEYYTLHRYWDIDDYEEVTQPRDQPQGPAQEDNISDPAVPVLADDLTGALDTEDNISDPALPVLADYFPGTLDTKDNGLDTGDTSSSSSSRSHSYTHLMRDVIVDDPRTIVTYISPTEDNT